MSDSPFHSYRRTYSQTPVPTWNIRPITEMFACVPRSCGGMCDKCRQTARGSHQTPDGGAERPDSPFPSGGNREGVGTQPLAVCLCDPDTDAVCDRNCA